MKWNDLLNLVSDEPTFTSALLLAGPVPVEDLRRQLSRWTKAGKIIQLRRGVYALATPYRKYDPHPFYLANYLKTASYVSLQSALAHYGMIPESVPVVTSVTTGRPELVDTELGSFMFKHIKTSFLKGYVQVEVAPNQHAFLATPEKSLLDLIYLTPHGDAHDYLKELRLQHLEIIDEDRLINMAKDAGSAKLMRAAKRIIKLGAGQIYEEL